MPRYIDANALIEAIKHELWDWDSLDGITSTTVLKQTITDIQGTPTADVVERKVGRWVPIFIGEHGYSAGDLRCSVCGEPNKCYCLTKYCANCGAEMCK